MWTSGKLHSVLQRKKWNKSEEFCSPREMLTWNTSQSSTGLKTDWQRVFASALLACSEWGMCGIQPGCTLVLDYTFLHWVWKEPEESSCVRLKHTVTSPEVPTKRHEHPLSGVKSCPRGISCRTTRISGCTWRAETWGCVSRWICALTDPARQTRSG